MSDLRRERDTARNERDQLRRENQSLHALLGDIDPTYADAYATLCDIALNGTKADNPKLSSTFESQPPRYAATAYHLRREERRWQRQRATKLLAHIERITENGPPLVGPLNSTPLAQPRQNRVSVTPLVVQFRPSRSAPRGAPLADTN